MRMRMAGVMALAAALAAVSSNALAHGMQGGYGQPQPGHGPMHERGGGPMMSPGHHMGPEAMMRHGPGMMGPGMMGPGMMGPRMMGPRMMGPGMMGHGMMGSGMMGPCMMMGHGQMPTMGPMMGWGGHAPLAEDLSVDRVRHMMEHWVEMMQNPNVKLGEVAERDDDTITADVVTQDSSLVRRFAVDRHTGAIWPADTEE